MPRQDCRPPAGDRRARRVDEDLPSARGGSYSTVAQARQYAAVRKGICGGPPGGLDAEPGQALPGGDHHHVG